MAASPGHGIALDACQRIAGAHGTHLVFVDTPGGAATVRVVRPPQAAATPADSTKQ